MLKVAQVGLALLAVHAAGCTARDTSPAGQAAVAAARDSAARADSARAAEAAPTLKVTNVMIGKRIGAGDRVTEPTFQFDPIDTVYISIGSVGSPKSASFRARWINQKGQAVDSTSKTIQPTGRQHTELHAFRAKGWPPGTYRVTVYADGDSIDSKTFAVRKP